MDNNVCLCYNEEKGLYIQYCHECEDAIFVTYYRKGYKTTPFELPLENIKIRIASNFGFGDRSYLFALIEKDGIPLLDFSKEKITILNHSSIKQFSVLTEDWDALLQKIVIVCNSYTPGVCTTEAISYVDELCNILKGDSVEIKSTFHSRYSVKWEGKFIITLLVADRLRDLMDGLKVANIVDEELSRHILATCRHFLHNLKAITWDLRDSRTLRFAQTLKYVCEYMMNHGAEIEFLRYFQQAGAEE